MLSSAYDRVMKSRHLHPEPAREIALSGLKAVMSSGTALDEWLEKNGFLNEEQYIIG